MVDSVKTNPDNSQAMIVKISVCNIEKDELRAQVNPDVVFRGGVRLRLLYFI